MAFDPCNICGCIPSTIGDDLYQQAALNLACGIYTGLEDAGLLVPPPNIVPLTSIVIPFGSVAANYTPVGFVDVTKQISNISISNGTNATVRISFNGVDVHLFASAGQTALWQFPYPRLLTVETDVYMKYSTTPPGSGNVIISGFR